MDIDRCVRELKALGIDEPRLFKNEPMSKHTTFRIGGPADLFVSVSSEEEILSVIRTANCYDIPVTYLGNGSNVLVSDAGIRGIVLHMGKDFAEIRVSGNSVFSTAGALLKNVAQTAMENGLTGMESISGIPGNVGGAVFMNAGAYGGLVSDGISSVSMIDPLKELTLRVSFADMEFGYRSSLAMKNGYIVTGAEWKLERDEPAAILERMNDLAERRRSKQPLQYPSAGSVFKRPEGYFAGQLIEQAGLKGLTVGKAQVSDLHAGFIVNLGGATCSDVQNLISEIQKRVMKLYGVELVTEVKTIGG